MLHAVIYIYIFYLISIVYSDEKLAFNTINTIWFSSFKKLSLSCWLSEYLALLVAKIFLPTQNKNMRANDNPIFQRQAIFFTAECSIKYNYKQHSFLFFFSGNETFLSGDHSNFLVAKLPLQKYLS